MKVLRTVTDAYGVGGLVCIKNINAYGCLRWIWVADWTEAFTMVEDGVFGLTWSKDKNKFYSV